VSFTRLSDRWKKPTTIAGFFILVVWAALELFAPLARRPSDTVTHLMLALGSGLISPLFLVDLVRAWRGTAPPPASPPAVSVVPPSEGEVDG
jgi:hypothetical protein